LRTVDQVCLARAPDSLAIEWFGESRNERAVAGIGDFAFHAVLPAGEHLRARLSGPQFDRAVLALLAASGATLVVRALAG